MAIQNRLRELREARGLTQVDVAAKLHVSQAHVSRVESGYEPSLGLAVEICRVLDVELSDVWPMGTDPDAVEVLHDAEATSPDAAA
jgi:putative transcriptional regulator